MQNKPKKVIIAMSGGVDSSVAALLLKKQGYEVEGVYIQVWSNKDYLTQCPWHDDIASASSAAEKIGIRFRSLHLEKEYKKKVVEYMIRGYETGITPNPDIMCNREIKFGVFLEWAMDQKADFITTGHYARNPNDFANTKFKYKLLKGVDKNKDQSYFLYSLTQEKLSKILFPIGDYQKSEVRQIAKSAGLLNWDREDSQGICFIGKVQLPKFLQEYIKPRCGDVITTEGKKLGEHNGIYYYTIGQRHGLDLGSLTNDEPYYIVEKRLNDNVLVVAKGRENPALYSNELICGEINWIAGSCPTLPLKCKAKIRYKQEDQECIVENPKSQNSYIVKFKKPQWAVAPGQAIVFYHDDEVLGGGMIKNH